MKKIFFLLFLILLVSKLNLATTYYSGGNLAANSTNSWWTNNNGTGSHPSNFTTAGNTFIIQAGHSMTTSNTWTVSGTGSSVQINGTLVASYAVNLVSLIVNNGGTYQHNINGGTIPTATWNTGSTCIVSGATTTFPLGTSQSFSNFTWSSTNTAAMTGFKPTAISGNFSVTAGGTGTNYFQINVTLFTIGGNLNLSNTANLKLGTTTSRTLTVAGNFSMSGGTLTMSAGSGIETLNIAGNFSQTGGTITETSTGSGTIVFNGSSVQTVTSSGTISNTINFSINQANTTSGVTLNSALNIPGTLTLTKGIITSTSANLLTLGSSASISGGSATSFVNGPLAITGTGTKTFPIGSGSAYRPVTLGTIAGTTPVITAAVSNSGSGGTPGSGLSTISTVRYWQISYTGTFSSCTVNLTYGADDGVTDYTNLRISSSSTLKGTYTNKGGAGSANSSGTITSNSISSLGFFALANATGGGNALPVELNSFIALKVNNNVQLNWTTATEVNNFGFDVERSVDSTNWEKIVFVSGSGNSNSSKEYSYVDEIVSSGIYYYRLKQIDNDGGFTYSKSIKIELGGSSVFSLGQNYPNPFNPATVITYQIPQNSFVKLEVYNILGKKIATLVSEEKASGKYSVSFSADKYNLVSGIYFYSLSAGKYNSVKKFILMK